MTTSLWIACAWVAFAPLGYVVNRRFSRALFSRWTRSDRLLGIALAVFSGPMLPISMGLFALVDRLTKSEWGNREVKW